MNKQTIFRWFSLLTVVALLSSFWAFHPTGEAQAAFGDRITISNNQFLAGGQRIWINGANTPWNNWNDFGGNYNASWWDNHFAQLHANGVNATRVWMIDSGEVGINIDATGHVSGATDAYWANLDSFFQIAQTHQIYIMATLMSFDSFKNTYTTYTDWRAWLNSDTNIDSYMTNYLTPFVNRYKSNPYLWSIDLMNEPDWVYENAEDGQFPWARMQSYFARASQTIHTNSPILVTVGMGMPKYMSSCPNGCQGNMIADSVLKAIVNSPNTYIDFYASHYYPWEDPYFAGIPFYQSPTSYFGSDPGKPVLIGEEPANGSTGHTLAQDYENAYLNGWQGVMPWTSNGVDSNGGFDQVISATGPFLANHPSLVFPGVGTGPTNTPTITPTNTPVGPTFTPTRTPTRTNTPSGPTLTPTRTPTRTNTPSGPTSTPTRTPTRTNTPTGPTLTPTRTPTPTVISGTPCTPTSTITAPFTFDGAGTFCLQSSSLGSYINNWNLASLTINGVNITGQYVPSSAYPAKINGFWYISYTGNFAWSHFETK